MNVAQDHLHISHTCRFPLLADDLSDHFLSQLNVPSTPCGSQVNAVIRRAFLPEASVVFKEVILAGLDDDTRLGRSTTDGCWWA